MVPIFAVPIEKNGLVLCAADEVTKKVFGFLKNKFCGLKTTTYLCTPNKKRSTIRNAFTLTEIGLKEYNTPALKRRRATTTKVLTTTVMKRFKAAGGFDSLIVSKTIGR